MIVSLCFMGGRQRWEYVSMAMLYVYRRGVKERLDSPHLAFPREGTEDPPG